MAEPKKKDFEDPVSAKIQRKFDLIFSRPKSLSASDEHSSAVFNPDAENNFGNNFEDDINLDGDISMSSSSQKKSEAQILIPSLDLDFEATGTNIEFGVSAENVGSNESKEPTKLSVVPDDDGLDFDLDFADEASENQSVDSFSASAETVGTNQQPADSAGFEIQSLDENEETSNEMDTMFDEAIADAKNHMPEEGTQKTVLFDRSQLMKNEVEDFELETTGSSSTSADLMSTDEVKANIDATIKDILKPKSSDSTQEIDLSSMVGNDDFSDFEIETSKNSLGTPPLGFNVNSDSQTKEFDLNTFELADKEIAEDIISEKAITTNSVPMNPVMPSSSMPSSAHTSYVSDEESTRFHATIRQLREEREELLMQIKGFKLQNRELEQDNLTLKAALDESKIEVSILRKRHMTEIEDMKYRLALNEEKKAMAIEQARLAESKREKLEQRVRIDFNQVKQREKELETKLEMLSIDVDSQVQSRDQKILELRRKIDSLEFNMENVSIKEQKSEDDKRKLEDKLNKIMKTLRHSIKNLEDDIDQVNDEAQDDNNDDHRTGKNIKYE